MMRSQPSQSRRKVARGFTIVEFMVAMGIGLIVSLVIGQIFVGSRQSFSSQDDAARMQETMRAASQILTRTIRMAGFRNNTGLDPAGIFPKATTPAIAGADNVATAGLPSGTNPVQPTGAAPAVVPDTITVRYQGVSTAAAVADGSVVDCIGTSIPAGTMSSNTFGIRPVTKADGSLSSSLFCSTDGGVSWPANNEVIPDVDNMQILYGIDTDNDGAANAYVRIVDAADVDMIVGVRIWVLLRSPTASHTSVTPATYSLGGVNYSYNDRFVRRVLSTTINLRNRTL